MAIVLLLSDLNSNLGNITTVSGTYKTAAWAAGTNTATWTAPATGVYLIFMKFELNDSSLANRQSYKQLQVHGTATRPLQIPHYDVTGTGDSQFVARTIVVPVVAETGQTVYPYVHTGTANIVYNVQIFAVRLK